MVIDLTTILYTTAGLIAIIAGLIALGREQESQP